MGFNDKFALQKILNGPCPLSSAPAAYAERGRGTFHFKDPPLPPSAISGGAGLEHPSGSVTPLAGTSRIMRVVRLMDEPDWQSRLSPIEEIFFATSPSAKTLRPDERQLFKERWLGRYIAYDIESFFVAITVSTVAGYLAGCLDNPAHNPRFADIGYYASFGPLCDPYPCHLHINLDERYRNRGIGSALIAAFAAQAASAGLQGSSNKSLYFQFIRHSRNEAELIEAPDPLLARRLSRRPPVTINEAAKRLAEHTGRDEERCRNQLFRLLSF
jgi:GNAT superfamily N-acetyltransferase